MHLKKKMKQKTNETCKTKASELREQGELPPRKRTVFLANHITQSLFFKSQNNHRNVDSNVPLNLFYATP